MTIFRTSAALTAFAAAAFAAPAFADAKITDEASCQVEGGTMVNVKNSDYCLVPIRDEAYADPVYDGNQLGVVDCPGSKLNDDLYCMYPVTIRPAPASQASNAPAAPIVNETKKDEGMAKISKAKAKDIK